MNKKKQITKEKIFELYGDFILNNGETPKNVYLFAKSNDFEEKEFYSFFSSFDHVEKEMLSHLFNNSWQLVNASLEDKESTAKEQLLNVYYVFFENLTMNRSLVMTIIGDNIVKNANKLSLLRETHQQFISTLGIHNLEIFENASNNFKKIKDKSQQDLFWLHLLSIIQFWKNDDSPDFEKTDIYIEKTIDTGFEFIENEPLKKLIDLGKFLWKERK